MIIGLVGRSRVGKDTAARVLVERHGFVLRRLAQPVKEACRALYGWSDETLESHLKDVIDRRYAISPRSAMVHLTRTIQAFMGTDFFTRRFFECVTDTHVVIPDVRYEHDVDEIHARGGITIRIVRPDGPQYESESHIDMLQTTHVIENTETIDVLEKKINLLINGTTR